MRKSILSILLTIILTLNLFLSALAQQLTITATEWYQTFEGIGINVAPQGMKMTASVNSQSHDVTAEGAIAELTENNITTGGKMGVYGKSDADTSFFIKGEWDGASTPFDGTVTVKTDIGEDEKRGAILNGLKSMSDDTIVHIGFEYAIDSYGTKRSVNFQSKQSSTAISDAMNLFTISESGVLTFLGASTDNYVMPLNRFVRFDIFLKEPNRTAGSFGDLYLDGKLVVANKVFDAKSGKTGGVNGVIDPLRGLGNLLFVFPFPAVADDYPKSESYLDNYKVSYSKESTEIPEIFLSHDDAEISGKIDNVTKQIVLPDSITAEEFVSGLNVSGAVVRDLDGAIQTGSLTTGYVAVPRADDAVYYYKLEAFHQSFALFENFKGKTITDESSLENETALSYTGSAAVIKTVDGIGGRPNTDTSLSINAENGNLSWTSDLGVSDEKVVIEVSVLAEEASDVSVSAKFSDTVEKDIVTGLDRKNAWFKIAAAVNLTDATWSIYKNGEAVTENAQIDSSLTQIDAITALNINITGGKAYVDELKISSGEYVNVQDLITVSPNSTNTIIDNSLNQIYVSQGIAKEVFVSDLSLSANSTIAGFYTDKTLTEKTSEITDGCFVVFKNLTNSVYTPYEIKFLSEVMPIKSAPARYEVSETENSILAPAYTTVSSFLNAITLEAGHTGSVVDENDVALASNSDIGKNSGNKYRVSYTNLSGTYTKDYAITNTYFSLDFSDLKDNRLSLGDDYHGLVFNRQGSSGGVVYLEGEEDARDSSNTVGKLYSKPNSLTGDSKATIRLVDIPTTRVKSPFVISFDMYCSYQSNNELIVQHTHQNGSSGKYYTLFSFNSSGAVVFAGSQIATYNQNTWNNIVFVLNPSGGTSKIFFNGKQVFSNTVGVFQKTIDHIDNMIFCYGAPLAERITYLDNFEFYPISEIGAFDATPMDTTIKDANAEYKIIDSDRVIRGYGPATPTEFLELLTFPNGSTRAVYQSDGITPVSDDEKVADGMKLIVTSEDGNYTSTYEIGESVKIEPIKLNIGDRSMAYLIPGDATGWASIYSVMPFQAKLTLTYTDGTSTNTVEKVRTADDKGLTELVTDIVANVKNVSGEKLTLTLTDPETGSNLANPIVIEWQGRLDYSSEIMPARYGATSIATITLDDGIMSALDKCNTWFAQYGLKGSSVIWSDRAAENLSRYRTAYEKGYIDVTSHSKTHSILSLSFTNEQRLAELQGSRDTLRSYFPGQEVLTFAPSNNVMDAISTEMAPDYYWAIRQGKRGYNSLDPSETGIGGWYDLKIQGSYNPLDESGAASTLNETANIAASKPMWVIYMYHGIEAKDGVGTLPVKDGVAASHFQTLGNLQAQNKLWVATFNEATKYIRERQNTTISDVATETSRTITLTMDTDKLPASVFNYPLTIRSQVPDEWADEGTYIKVTQGGKIQSPIVKNIDGGLYIYFDAVPTDGIITLETTNQRPSVTVNEIRLSADGELTQTAGLMEAVNFTASVTPSDNVDLSGIEWYLNGVRQEDLEIGALEFGFITESVGKYDIFVKDRISGNQSKTITVTVKEPGLHHFEDYETHSLGASLGVGISVSEYPTESGNYAARFEYDPAQKYPSIHRTVAASEGVPVVFAGRIAIDNAKSAYFLEYRNTKNVNSANRKTVFKVKNGNISADVEASPIGKIPASKWLHYSVSIIPAPVGSLSKLRITLSSPDLTDINGENKGADIIFEKDINLDNLELVESGTGNMVHNHDFSSMISGIYNYLDNTRLYTPQPSKLVSPEEEVGINQVVNIDFNKYIYNFEDAVVTVTKEDGTIISVSSINYDKTNPTSMGLRFDDGVLEKSTVYNVLLNGGYDALGEAFSGTAQFTTSNFDPITEIEISSQGSLQQKTGALETVTFRAVTTPESNVATSTVTWYVNNQKQDSFGLDFTFTPEDLGTYNIYAMADGTAVSSNVITIDVTAGDCDYVEISSSGSLVQYSDSMSKVVFSAKGMPEDRTFDVNSLKWYLNGEVSKIGSATFEYTPTKVGRYTVYAKLSDDESTKSNEIIINVATKSAGLQNYLANDDFENHGNAGTKLSADNRAPWTGALSNETLWEEIANDPVTANAENKVLKFVANNGSSTVYPRLEMSGIEFSTGKPVAVSGKMYLQTASTQFILQIQNSAGSSTKREAVRLLTNGKVEINGVVLDTEVVKWLPGGWIWFNAVITPGETAADSHIRLILSGNISGSGVVNSCFATESSLSLSAPGLGTNRTIFYNTAVTASKGDVFYLDDAKIYYPDPVIPVVIDVPYEGDNIFELLFSHDIDPATISKDNIFVLGMTVDSVEFNKLAPERVAINLSEPLEGGQNYTVSFDGVKDIDGSVITKTVNFSVEGRTDINFAVTDAYFELNGTKVETISETTKEVIANITVNGGNIKAPDSIEMSVCMYQDGKLKKIWNKTCDITTGETDYPFIIKLPSDIKNAEFKLLTLNSFDNLAPYHGFKLLSVDTDE